MIDLMRFCANESDPRDNLRKPWKHGEWVYATNDHVCVRVLASSMPDVAECDKAPPAQNLFLKHMEQRQCDFLLMPPLRDLMRCKPCRGTGRIRAIKCIACNEGMFNHFGDMYDCQRCADSAGGPGWEDCAQFDDATSGVILPCYECDGMGASMRQNGNAALGESSYSLVYLHWLAALPQLRICPGSSAELPPAEQVPAVFLFDGGQALLMPRRD